MITLYSLTPHIQQRIILNIENWHLALDQKFCFAYFFYVDFSFSLENCKKIRQSLQFQSHIHTNLWHGINKKKTTYTNFSHQLHLLEVHESICHSNSGIKTFTQRKIYSFNKSQMFFDHFSCHFYLFTFRLSVSFNIAESQPNFLRAKGSNFFFASILKNKLYHFEKETNSLWIQKYV